MIIPTAAQSNVVNRGIPTSPIRLDVCAGKKERKEREAHIAL